MAPLTKEQRSEAARKAAATRRANREAAAARQQQENKTNSTRNWSWLPWVILAVFVFGMLVWHPWTASNTPVVPAATETPDVTEAPAATEAPDATEAPAPAAISCDTPSIKAGLNAADIEYGEYLDTVLGKRMTFTSRRLLVPNKAWNDPLTSGELKTVEETWQYLQVCIPDEMFGRIFASGFEQGTTRYESGVLMTLEPGMYEFNLLNGEIVLWYPEQDKFEQNDLVRIFDQIRNGNFDIHSELAFFATTTDLLPKIPADLVQKNNVQIVPSLDPTIK